MNPRKFRLLAALAFYSAAEAQEDATKVFRALEPSVVLISSVESSGSGVVLSADGLIITNYHVVNTPLPITVEAIVEEGGKLVKKTFPNTPVTKVHLRNDLALLKVDARGVRFKAAPLSKSPDDAVAGSTCYVLGFPVLTDRDRPQISITKGIISSARQLIDDIPYIQLDAALNPGNSGGALINQSGLLIGIPTLRFEGAESIGMATPIVGISINQFVEKKDRIGNPAEAQRLSDIANTYHLADALAFGSDRSALLVALYLQRQALALEPNNPKWYRAISTMYFRVREPNLARAYAEAAVALKPGDFESRLWLASILEVSGEAEEAAKQRLECLSHLAEEQDPQMKKRVFEELMDQMIEREDWFRALYLLSWADVESKGAMDMSGVRERLVRQGAERYFPEDVIAGILQKTVEHSLTDMEKLFLENPPREQKVNPAPLRVAAIQTSPSADPGPESIVSQIAFAPGSHVVLSDASPGVAFYPDRGTVEWKPLLHSKASEARALFIVTNQDGSEEIRVVVIPRS